MLSITLHRGWNTPGIFVWSPFVTKVEARLRFAGLKYKTDAGGPRSGPKGKIPYVEIQDPEGDGPKVLGDSSEIIKALVQNGNLPDLNAELSPVERAYDMALRALLEEKLYFYHGYEKWHENYYIMRDHSLWSVPWPMRIVIGLLAYRKTMTTLYGQGTARFSGPEIAAFRVDIWENLNALLLKSRSESIGNDDHKQHCFWILGKNKPSEADAVLFGFIVGSLISSAAPTSQKVVRGFPVIVDYAQRIRNVYFPDYTSLENY